MVECLEGGPDFSIINLVFSATDTEIFKKPFECIKKYSKLNKYLVNLVALPIIECYPSHHPYVDALRKFHSWLKYDALK